MANDLTQPQLADTLSACCKSIGVCAEYIKGTEYAPHYPVPVIPLAVKYDYVGCINIDDVSDPDDPVIVYMFDSWTGLNV